MAANQLRAPSVMLGFWANPSTGQTTLGLNAAATWLAMSFVVDQAKTLNTVRLYLNTLTGSPATSECTCDLYSDNGGVPNVSIDGPKSAGALTAGAWTTWSGFTTALTAGTQYWLVFKNTNATPASNFPTWRFITGTGSGRLAMPLGAGSTYQSAAPLYGWCKVHTTNSGTAWATGAASGVGGMRLGFSDSTYDGLPIESLTAPNGGAAGDRATGKQEAGVVFNVPANMIFNCRGAWMIARQVATPGNLVFKLYQGTTLLASAYAIPVANVTTANSGDGYTAFFSSAQRLSSANNPYRLTMSDSNTADASTVGYNSNLYTWDSDANSLALKPMDGSLQETVTLDGTLSPPTFTDTNTSLFPFALLGDTSGEFTSTGGGGPVGNNFRGGFSNG